MAITLPPLPNYISIPDYDPHCVVCGCRALNIADFRHTNFRGGIYECWVCTEAVLFIDQEDSLFSINYWGMNDRKRATYLRQMDDNQRRVFFQWNDKEQNRYFRMKKKDKEMYMQKATDDFYVTIKEDNYKSAISQS